MTITTEYVAEPPGRARRNPEATKASILAAARAEFAAKGLEGARGIFRDGVDPLELYISIAGMTFFYFANGLTMSAIFGRDLSRRDAVASYRDHIVTLILAGLRP